MAQDSRIIGKHTLESLTVGMYADNRIVYREYVQNATDAIDKAITAGIVNQDEGCIDITIDTERREVRIRDNGIGIPAGTVYHALGDIGRSDKTHAENRGFRGIGRLGGLGYCTELQFITSYQGEFNKTITLWDARELRQLLKPNNDKYESIIEVIDAVTIQDTQPEQQDAHYFEVILSGIATGHDNLLDIENIRDYLSQVAPVPFNYNQGMELQKINNKLRELSIYPEEYKIFLHDLSSSEQIYKPYRRQVRISDKKHDFIKDIQFFEEFRDDNTLFFFGWRGVTELSGMIKEDSVNGLRVRKRNILIGNNRTLDEFFGNNKTYQNFNRWYIGEIYVFDDNLIPNARRDDFEKNEAYFVFKQKVKNFTHKLARLPHPYSKLRSTETKLRELPQNIEVLENELSSSSITEVRKSKMIEQVGKLKKKANQIDPNAYTKVKQAEIHQSTNDDNTPHIEETQTPKKVEKAKRKKRKLLKELENLEEKIVTSTDYAAKRLPSHIPRTCKKQIDIIFNVIDTILDEGLARELKEKIIRELQPKRKTARRS
ncbi:MAG: hypothetical protein GY797_36065 [Deltaproteobacteria bacterium]|nr:hypothetical protein [Deltaproteobacteria bacterium]